MKAINKEDLAAVFNAEVDKHPGAICIANYKGGVGKTTITTLIGYYLAKKGKRVLLIDIDAQCSLTLAVGYDLNNLQNKDKTIFNLVLPTQWTKIRNVEFNQYIYPVPDAYAPSTLKIIRGSFDVDELDITISQSIINSKRHLNELYTYCRQMLYSLKDQFDYILIDCPPNKMYLTQAMLRACPYYIAVTIPDKISTFGVPRMKNWIDKIEPEVKPKMLGCILNGVNRAGGYETGTANQKTAEAALRRSITNLLNLEEKKVIGTSPVLAHIPKLDVISRFLSQDEAKTARFDFSKQPTGQSSVDTIMMNLISKIETTIKGYAKP
jgi:cellulose biosynthesis protein BcsQ